MGARSESPFQQLGDPRRAWVCARERASTPGALSSPIDVSRKENRGRTADHFGAATRGRAADVPRAGREAAEHGVARPSGENACPLVAASPKASGLRLRLARRARGRITGRMDPTDVQPPNEKEPARRSPKGERKRRRSAFEERLRALRDALRAARQGDFTVRLPVDGGGDGVLDEVALAFNALLEENEALAEELDRIAHTVGTEGQVSEHASLGAVGGGWAAAIDSTNALIDAMAFPVTEATRILGLVAKGDLSRDMPVHLDGQPLQGEFRRLGNTVNAVMDQLRSVSAGVSRVVREIGTEGTLGLQASVTGLQGTWRGLVDDVNLLAGNLTAQVRNIALVSTAIAKGDLSQKITVETRGEILELKNAINATVDQLRSFAAEVIRVAREVGTEGKLGAQADVRGVSGVWQELTDSVNSLASNLTSQVRNIAQIATAIANGDLSQKITVEAKGEILELKNTFNALVDRLQTFAAEVTRVATEVGTEGRLGGQADVRGVSGTWKDLTDSVNMLAGNLTDQVRNITLVTTAIANGDLSKKITVEVKGEILELKNTVNALVDRLQTFASEVTRVAREVGTEGKLGGQADVKGVSGTWKDLTDNVNLMARNLTDQVRGIAKVVTAVATGDLSQKFVVEAKGEIASLADTINNMTDTLRTFAEQVTTVAREVGIDGKLGGQARVPGVAGTWRDLTENVNMLAGNLTNQVRNIALVSTAIAQGDLSQQITVEAKGEIFELKNTINMMVEQLRTFASEVTRVAKEVGTEGKLGGQAQVPGVAGTWKGLTDNVNMLAGNLTNQVRNIALVTTAVANGDLSKKITVEAKGEILELKSTVNAMVEQLRTFAAEVTRVAKEVGTDGELGGQARVPGVAGTWKALTDNVNVMASNLTGQVRGIAKVVTAVANGDLEQKFVVEAKGEIAALADTINNMTETLRTFAAQVTTVAREVGTEGKLGGQAQVPGVAGTWQELTESVNVMASNLTSQVRGIAKVVTAVADGDLAQKLVLEARGEIASLAETINNMTDTLRTFADQVTTVAREVGMEGKLGGQARVPGAAGTWRDLTDSVNMLAGNLTSQVRNIALVTTAVANGDLSKKITVEAKGEILELKDTTNAMVEQLRTFAAEVTRVAREVGTDGQLGGQARVPGVSGTWKDLTDSVNLMASNLTDQVRGISKVVTAVATGDLTKKLFLVAKGEIATLADTINNMTDTLRTFAAQVTTVAREVGIEGKLGGQAKVPGAAGTWRDLTDNVNQLAANLTTQVRAISEVATAVIQGDLTRSISVETRGEVLALKDTINQMIANLRDTTRTNMEQDWLKTNLAKFFGIMQGQRDLESLTNSIMSQITPVVGAQHGAFYLVEPEVPRATLKLTSTYAYVRRKGLSSRFAFGEGLVGQCALEKKPIVVSEVPEGYVHVTSGLGEAPPRNIAVFPVLFEEQVRGVIELGSFHEFTAIQLGFLEQLMLNIGLAINLIGASMRTEELLQQLQGSNVELDKRRKELEEKAQLLEVRNREIAEASTSLEAKALELSKVSQYKSQFLTNMSHEIRTPLNSMMVLAQLLETNAEKHLSKEQQEWAATIHSAGRDLLALINQILDLSKVEAGRIETHIEPFAVASVREFVERGFRALATQKGLALAIEIADGAPATVTTDPQLLEQILKNLLSNAVKFTEHGQITLRVDRAPDGTRYASAALQGAPAVVQFAVQDTGIGISAEKLATIFDAFQQGDTSITRRYGGTGLGLTISREYARILGGEIAVTSTPGEGSTFRLYLPLHAADLGPHAPAAPVLRRAARAIPPLEAAPEEQGRLTGAKVLVVEDDARNLYALTSFLEKQGADVYPAATAREAYARLKETPDIGLILMDIMMPEIDGYQATREIHAIPEFADIPIVALTAKASEADREQCLAAGCAEYIVKPIENRQLLAMLLRYLGRAAERPGE
jgi:HAMP domain-containing protein/signal transduction histidine kinase/ActR/RegA family two-component response regulator